MICQNYQEQQVLKWRSTVGMEVEKRILVEMNPSML
jgi:hypothetical protein